MRRERERRRETAGGGRTLGASPPPKLHRALVICSVGPSFLGEVPLSLAHSPGFYLCPTTY